jgi:hypothetical protein
MPDDFVPAFVINGCGWEATNLGGPDAPLLAVRLAKVFDDARSVFAAASEAELDEFWAWLREE